MWDKCYQTGHIVVLKKVRSQKDVSDASSRGRKPFEIFDLLNIQKSLKLCEIHLYLARYQYQRFVV